MGMTVDTTRLTLLTRVRDRDDSRAWDEFTGLYRRLFLRYAGVCGLSGHEAEDAAEACMAVLADHVSSPDYDAGGIGFKRWMAALARRCVRNATRERARTPDAATSSETQPHVEPEPDEEFERIWNDEHLRHCLEQLRIEIEFKTFEAFRRLALDQWPVERVCQRYDLTPQYVYAMKSRLTQRLRRLMQSLLGE